MLFKIGIRQAPGRTFPGVHIFLIVFVIACPYSLVCGQANAGEASLWHQYYEPMEDKAVYAFVQQAFTEARRLYGEPVTPVLEIHIRWSVKRLRPGSLARADIVDWQGFAKTLSKNHAREAYLRVWQGFTPKLREELKTLAENGEKLNFDDKTGAVANLNLLLTQENFYNKRAFAGVKIPRKVLRMGGYGFLAKKSGDPMRFNRALLNLLFPGSILPLPPRAPVNEGIELCECADAGAGRFVIYVATPFNRPESRLELAHEAAHLLNPYLYDWYVEGLNNLFAREMIFKYYSDKETTRKYWRPWEILFEKQRQDNPYAISYFMMDEMYNALKEKGLKKFLCFAAWNKQKREKMRIDIDSWLASLPEGERAKVLAIICRYAPRLNKYKGKTNAFMLPEAIKGKLSGKK